MLDHDQQAQQELLSAIYKVTEGSVGKTAKMWDIGELLGWERNVTENLAMELVGEGLLEIKSLSGALSLTEAGLSLAGGPANAPGSFEIGIDEFVIRMEGALPDLKLDPDVRKNLDIDLAILKLQRQRSVTLPMVQKEVLTEIGKAMKSANIKGDLPETIEALLAT